MITLISSFSSQRIAVEHATGDNALLRSVSAQQVSMDRTSGEGVLITSSSASKSGFDIVGVTIAVPDMTTNIVRLK